MSEVERKGELEERRVRGEEKGGEGGKKKEVINNEDKEGEGGNRQRRNKKQNSLIREFNWRWPCREDTHKTREEKKEARRVYPVWI